MKKIFGIVILLLFIIFGYLYLNYNNIEEDNISFFSNVEILEAEINDYYIFGNHFNIFGKLNIENNDYNYSLVIKNEDEEYTLDCIFEKKDGYISFYTSSKLNTGINLDELNKGKYYLLIKEENGENIKYYSLINNTTYDNMEYYTITKNDSNNKVNIIFDSIKENNRKVNYIMIKVEKTKLPKNVYDITIDPGHGGMDTGAYYKYNGNSYNEADFTLDIALKLKKELEKNGYKVLLTRDKNEDLEYYNDSGRAVLPNKYHTKLCISLHLNSEKNMNYGGVEVYTPNDIEYSLARLLASNISKINGYSKKKFNKIEDGIYFNGFTEESIISANEENEKNGLKKYDIEVGTPQMYMIREVGGKLTHAYVDGRNEKYGLNPYYQSNQVAEPYLIELGYINYEADLIKFINNSNDFSVSIKNSLIEYLK